MTATTKSTVMMAANALFEMATGFGATLGFQKLLSQRQKVVEKSQKLDFVRGCAWSLTLLISGATFGYFCRETTGLKFELKLPRFSWILVLILSLFYNRNKSYL